MSQTAALAGNAGTAGYIQLSTTAAETTIDRSGTIWQDGVAVAQIGVIDVDNYDYLEKYGENMYNIVDGGNIVDSEAEVYQGYLEMSNVQVVNNMVDMIVIARAYESNQKLIQTIDSMTEISVNQVGKL